MSQREIFAAMIHNAKGMIEMGLATENMKMALVGHATLVAILAVDNGDDQELSMMLMAFTQLMEEKKKIQIEKEIDPKVESMLKEMGIGLSED